MELKKGTFVRHPKEEIFQKWGVGIVLEDERSGQVPVFFENDSKRKVISTSLVKLEIVDDPGTSAVLLQNALHEDVGDRLPFPIVLEKFLMNFPGGMYGSLFVEEERNYKVNASQIAQELLSEPRLLSLIEALDWQTLAVDIRRAFTEANLLASFEFIKLGAAFKSETSTLDIAKVFHDLLYGQGDVYQRVESAGKKLGKYELDKWTIVTYLLFMIFPEKYMFVKPTMTKEAAENRGFDIQYDSRVNANTYKKVMLLSQDLFQRLTDDKRKELHPRDMIDIQSFMWCTSASGWTAQELRQAKEKME